MNQSNQRFHLTRTEREAQARTHGYSYGWPPEKASIRSPQDARRYLERLESGEHAAGFIVAVGDALVAFFRAFEAEHFRRLARVLMLVATDRTATHRAKLRAVQTAVRPLIRAAKLLPKLKGAGVNSLQAHLLQLLGAFAQELTAQGFGSLGEQMVALIGPEVRGMSARVRAANAALTLIVEALDALASLREMESRLPRPGPDLTDPVERRRAEEFDQEMAELDARLLAEIEKKRLAKTTTER